MEPQQPVVSPPTNYQQPIDNTKRKKLYVILGILVGIGLLVFFINTFTSKDESPVILQRVIILHQEELRINKLADPFSNEFEFEKFRANFDILVESDRVALQNIFEQDVSKESVTLLTDLEVKTRFEAAVTTNSFITEYKSTMNELIQRNVTELKRLDTITTDPATESALLLSISNHDSLLKQLDKL